MQIEETYKKLNPHFPFLYFCLLAVLVFCGNRHSLFDQDEAAYAGFAKQMIESGNWVTPEFLWSEVHRKPPLHFWNIAISYKLFGINEFAVRFPSALFILLTYLLVFFAAKKIVGKTIALLWVVVLSTSLLVPALAKLSVTDSTLLFFTTACAFSLYFILQQKSWLWVFVFWVSFALALLTKGPPVVLFTIPLAGLLVVLHPNRKNLIRLHPWFFLPMAAAPLVIWGYSTIQYDGGKFVQWMIDWYILKRIGGGVFGQTGFPGMHLLMIILFFIPWLMFLPQAFKALFTQLLKDKKEGLFFSAWFIAGWFIYELSPSKLPGYVVAAHIPLALFIAKALNEKKLPAKAWVIIHYFFVFVLFTAIAVLPFVLQLPTLIKILFATAGVILLTGTITSAYLLRTKWFNALIIIPVLFQIALWLVLLPAADDLKNITNKVAEYAEENADTSSHVLIANAKFRPPSLPFYLGNNFKSVRDEFDFSILMATYYADAPCVLILNEKQINLFSQLIPGIIFYRIEAVPALKNAFTDYYILVKPASFNTTEEITLPEWVKQPLSLKSYEEKIRNTPEWFQDLQRKAKESNASTDEMITSNANWVLENEMLRYNYLLQILQTKRWRTDIEKRAAEKGIGLEQQFYEDADFIFKQGRVY